MVIVVAVGFAVVLVVLAVAAVAVMRESARMEREPPTRWFNVAEAVDWVVEHISDEAAATLTIDDVHVIIGLQLEYFERRGVSRNGKANGNGLASRDVIVGGSETVEFIVREAANQGLELTNQEVHAVIETQLAYLRSIGVVGPRADETPGEEPPD